MFQINVETLPPAENFPYLDQTIAYNNSNCAEVYQNLRKARRQWVMVVRVLERIGATVCPFPSCPGSSHTCNGLRSHFII